MKITCPQCGFARTVDDEILPPRAVMATCPKCAHRFKFRDRPPQSEPAADPNLQEETSELQTQTVSPSAEAAPGPRPVPQPEPAAEEDLWENLEALSEGQEDAHQDHEPEASTPPAWEKSGAAPVQAFAQTVLDVLSDPRRFFSSMLIRRELLKPLLFLLLIVEAVALSRVVWQMLDILPPGVMMDGFGQNTQAVLALIVYPLQAAVAFFLDVGVNHLLLRVFNADSKGFSGTFRAAAYSSVPLLFLVVPYIGLPIGLIGFMVYKFFGFKYVHRAGTQQVLAVLTIPILLGLIGLVLMILLFRNTPVV
ncbi:YIP1 family protein [Desulfomicrobium orale]|uniref:Yip1 domain-containing protein n=1 Tax=Desulfomicrobium orale DSM 12838 TaxID=888061 RepID=A0A120KN15_9BACT|nr:YIP1 family protein [Desulfomicrobium orale]AMD92736.1 hypothetical protein AXF15_06220 [Desulfomicrobium orale DSM 12838]